MFDLKLLEKLEKESKNIAKSFLCSRATYPLLRKLLEGASIPTFPSKVDSLFGGVPITFDEETPFGQVDVVSIGGERKKLIIIEPNSPQ